MLTLVFGKIHNRKIHFYLTEFVLLRSLCLTSYLYRFMQLSSHFSNHPKVFSFKIFFVSLQPIYVILPTSFKIIKCLLFCSYGLMAFISVKQTFRIKLMSLFDLHIKKRLVFFLRFVYFENTL